TCDTAVHELTALREAVERGLTEAEALDLSRVWPAVSAGIDRHDARAAWRRRLRTAPAWGVALAAAATALVWLRSPGPEPPRLAGYRSFQIVREERRRCAWETSEEFALPGGRLLHVLPKGMRDQAVVMQVKLTDGSRALVDTRVRLQNRGVMLFGVDQDRRAAEGALIIMLR